MPKFLLLLSFCFLLTVLNGQDRPPVFPEDVEGAALDTDEVEAGAGIPNKSKARGVSIDFTQVGGGTLKDEDSGIEAPFSELDNIQRLAFKMKFPILLQEKTKILGGYRYITETYNFDALGADFTDVFGAIDNRKFKSSGFELIGNQELPDKSSFTLRLKYTSQGSFAGLANFDKRYHVYAVQAVWTKQKNETFEWGLGAAFTSSFRRTIALPFVILNKNFNDKWGFESVLPGYASLRYNCADNTIFLFGPKYNSASYSFDVVRNDEKFIYNLNHSEVRLALAVQQKIGWWLWLDAEIGWQENFSTDFEAEFDPMQSFQAEPNSTPYFSVGLFLTPPDSTRK